VSVRNRWRVQASITLPWLMMGVVLSTSTYAEVYIAGQAGVTFPQALSDVERTSAGSGLPAGTKVSDLSLKTSVLYGLKLGYYLESLPWLGIEGEVFNTNPHVKQQTQTMTLPSGTVLSGTPSGSLLSVLTLATNLMVRYPGASFQPYLGVGPGLFFARNHFSTAAGEASTSTTQIGLNALAGIRYLATDHVALFLEGKYSHAQLNFGTSHTMPGSHNTYNAFHAAFGIAYLF
jgi:opacity protein-like surface antigen